jgi:CRISPR-associated protein (TIGR02710 family)
MDKNNKHKKVLIMTVGTGATGADIAHGLFFSIEKQNPEVVVFITSSESRKLTLPHLNDLLNKWGRNIQKEEKIIEEINDFEKLHNLYSELIRSYIRNGYDKQNIVVDYTSGTKAMSAALVSSGLALEVGTISYVMGDRKEGRVQSGTERISPISPTSIFCEKMLKQFVSLFNLYQFESAIELVKDFNFHPDYKNHANILINLARFFSAWDKFNFSDAFNLLKNLPDDDLQEVQLKGKFDKLFRPLLAELKKSELNYEKVDDIIFNSKRRASEGKYDDAVARLYRALEMIGQIEFEKEFKCKTDDVKLENLPDSERESVKFKYQSHSNKKIQLPMFKTFDVLLAVKNPAAVIFEENKIKIKEHINKRNYSILAHGSVPVAKGHFEDFFNFLISKFNLGSKSNRYSTFSFPALTNNI